MLAQAFVATLLATVAVAAPATVKRPAHIPAPVPMDADVEKWTIQDLSRTCNAGDTKCTWDFYINTHNDNGDSPYHCLYNVTGSPASKSPGAPAECAVFRVTTGYDPSGFNMLTPVHPPTDRIIYASYPDTVLTNGTTVIDESWKVEPTPSP